MTASRHEDTTFKATRHEEHDVLAQPTQNGATVAFTYDDADRRTLLTLPNGVTVEYGYDAASQVTGLTYKLGATTESCRVCRRPS
jgi:YD repeat-containing protein